MTTQYDNFIKQIQLAVGRRNHATDQWARATNDLIELVKQAHAAGMPVAQIARAADVTRRSVYQFLEKG